MCYCVKLGGGTKKNEKNWCNTEILYIDFNCMHMPGHIKKIYARITHLTGIFEVLRKVYSKQLLYNEKI